MCIFLCILPYYLQLYYIAHILQYQSLYFLRHRKLASYILPLMQFSFKLTLFLSLIYNLHFLLLVEIECKKVLPKFVTFVTQTEMMTSLPGTRTH